MPNFTLVYPTSTSTPFPATNHPHETRRQLACDETTTIIPTPRHNPEPRTSSPLAARASRARQSGDTEAVAPDNAEAARRRALTPIHLQKNFHTFINFSLHVE